MEKKGASANTFRMGHGLRLTAGSFFAKPLGGEKPHIYLRVGAVICEHTVNRNCIYKYDELACLINI